MTNILTRGSRGGRLADRERPVRPGLVLAVVLTGQFMALLDSSIVNVAAPSIHASLGASGTGLQLVVAGYIITYAVLLVTGARLGDILGHRRMFLAGLVLFTLASLGCGLAGSAGLLIVLRFAQGAGAAVMIPQVLSLIQRTHTGQSRARAMTRYSAVLAGGAVVGQLAGGLLISANLFGSDWRPVFLVNVPIGVALLAVGARALPPGRGEPGRTLDLPGLALLTPAVLAFVLPLVLGQPEHWPLWGWIMMAASIPLAAAFAAVERRIARAGANPRTPLIPGQVLRVPGIPVAIAALFTVMIVFSGFFFTLALHLQDALGYTPLQAGLTFAPAAATFGLVSLNWRRFPARWHGAVIVGGFVLFAAGLAGLAWVVSGGGTGAAGICLLAGLSGAGMAAAFSPLMTRVLLRVPVELAADATGVVVTVNQLGLLVGVATFGTLYLNLAGHLPTPAHLTAAAATPAHLPASALAAFRHASAHAEAITFLALAALAVVGTALAITHLTKTAAPLSAPARAHRVELPPRKRVASPHDHVAPGLAGASRLLGYIRACGKE